MRTWIDFKAVKERARFEPVLERYGLELAPRGAELVGKCPFHEEEKPSFSVNPEKGVFHCFGCGAKGNVLDFVARQEGVTIRKAAELVAEWLGMEKGEVSAERPARRARKSEEGEAHSEGKIASPGPAAARERGVPGAVASEDASTQAGLPAGASAPAANRPLSFRLQGIDPTHPYLASRGISKETAEKFGTGYYAGRGLFRGYVVIPLENEEGQLMGYLGRWPGHPPEGIERYRLPPRFSKSELLFNFGRVRWDVQLPTQGLVVVESCFSVFRLSDLGFLAVALLGSSLSKRQEGLIISSGASRITLLLDGDRAGREAALEMLPRLARQKFVRVAELPEGEQPDTASEPLLRSLLA